MRTSRLPLWIIAGLLLAPAFAGCISQPAAPTATQPRDAPLEPASGPRESEPPRTTPSPLPRPTLPPPNAPSQAAPAVARVPQVVIAHIDSGINPYHAQFRDTSPYAYVHPSRYLDGYPEETPALRISLNESDYAAARQRDAAVWKAVEPGVMYWIPGTRIVGAIHFDAGGACGLSETPPASYVDGGCEDLPILDDHGHGTMTASRMAGRDTSLCPDCRIVSIEGLGAQQVRWAADQGWIDVQTNSWGSIVPHVPGQSNEISDAFKHAASRMLTFAGSGNGLGFFLGFTPWPTYAQSTLTAGVVVVGGHDNGRVAHWSGAPPTVVADAYGGPTAVRDHVSRVEPDPISCCTSASSPYAAGAAARVLLEARRILSDTTTGTRGDVVAQGAEGVMPEGPLSDGKLTLSELADLIRRTAEPRPLEGQHDGLLHWMGEPRAPDRTQFGPGANPFCVGCVTAPVAWKEIPPDAPAYPLVGYGALNERSVWLATAVLLSGAALPAREAEDAFFGLDQSARGVVYG